MKILVLNPPFLPRYSRPQRSPAVTKSGTIYFPIWQAYCTGVLKDAGHEVSFIDAPAACLSLDDVLAEARQFGPRLVVVDTSTPSIDNDIGVVAKLRGELKDAFFVFVGTHVSAMAEETLNNAPDVDAVARREYDYTIKELAEVVGKSDGRPVDEDLRSVSGLSFRADGQVVHNEDRESIANLDDLPWVSKVYKEYLKIDDYFNPNSLFPMVTLITSRGCPFRCSFCVYPQAFTGRKYRFRSLDDVLNEIEYAIEAFPDLKCIFFEDDTLTVNKKRCLEFAEAILARGIKIAWTANSRIDVDLATMKKMREAGCRELCVGFESGDQKILDGMKKGTRVEGMYRFMEDARKAGILIHGCFMVGFSGEDKESAEKTIKLSLDLKPDTAQFYPVMVYPGTDAYDEYKEKGWLTAKSYSEWLTPEGLHNCVIRNKDMTSEELVLLCDDARRRFYLRPGYVVYKLGQLVRHPKEMIRTLKAARVFLKHLMLGSKVS